MYLHPRAHAIQRITGPVIMDGYKKIGVVPATEAPKPGKAA
jgi:hypothetical protein